MVPRAAFAWVTKRLKGAVRIPLITTNRINDPAIAESDPRTRRRRHGVDGAAVPGGRRISSVKAAEDRADEINTRASACNQACLDQIFARKSRRASSILSPAAKTESQIAAAAERLRDRRGRRGTGGPRVRDDGGGSAATMSRCSRRPPRSAVSSTSARRIPGKEEFAETLRYYRTRLRQLARASN